jgi:hypothetical protein
MDRKSTSARIAEVKSAITDEGQSTANNAGPQTYANMDDEGTYAVSVDLKSVANTDDMKSAAGIVEL